MTYLKFVSSILDDFTKANNFHVQTHGKSGMGEWYVRIENSKFILEVYNDRGGFQWIEIGTKVRPRPRAHLRSYSILQLRGFIEGYKGPHPHKGIRTQAVWLTENADKILDISLINSEELKKWSVRSS